ncbi:MAG: sodium:solute symporter family protein [Clostridiales Family XIII bacterium]|jgi:SSS family solute:Na+ symporter|nr:sodium:solute symporter family protein [Clostridiales Family XIII bacterium]
MTGQNVIAILIIALFMLIPLAMGAIAGKKSVPTTEDFFVQGRGMGSIAVFFTVAATWWSAFAFMGSNSYFFLNGPLYWTAIAWNILFGVLYFGVGKKIWYLGKINHFITAKDFFVHQFGSTKLGNVVAIISLIFTLPYLQIQLTGGAYLIEVASGGIISFNIAALLFYVVIIIYVWSGGLRAVAWTDIFYGVLLFFGMIVGGIFVAKVAFDKGGDISIFEQIRQVKPDNLKLGDAGVMAWLSMFIVTPIGSFMGPQLWTRMYAVKKAKLFNLMPFLLTVAAIAYTGSMLVGNSGVLLEPNTETPDKILPIMLYKYAPYILASLIIACGAAAAMSTANSQIHSMSAVWTVDIHQKYIKKDLTERQLVWVGRWVILILSAIAYIMCLFVPGLLVQIGLVALAGTGQIFIPTVGAIFWKRSNTPGAFAGLLVGVGSLCLFTFIPVTLPTIFSGGGGLISLILNFIVFVIISLATKPRDAAVIEKLRVQYNDFYKGKNMD